MRAIWAAIAIALLAVAPSANAATYVYDSIGRLVYVAYGNGQTVTYTYDAAGNRTQVIVGTNVVPIANSDSISTNENAAVSFDPRTNDSDVDGDALTIVFKTDGSHGTVAINGGGASLTYTPASGYAGSDSFSYTISDGHSHTATAFVAVTVISQPPVAVNDSISTNRNQVVTFDPRVNDSDPEGDTLTITGKTDGAHGTVAINGGGVSLTYTPVAGYTGSDSFNYTISDGYGNTATAIVSVTVNPFNQAPIAVADTLDISVSHDPGHSVTPVGSLDPRVNDSDPDGDPLTIIAVTNGANGTVTIDGGGTGVTYTYNHSVIGELETTDSFTYTISDGFGGTATQTVEVVISVTINQ